jgi:hypothetical protein
LFADAGYADLRAVLDPLTWQWLQEVWTTRYIFTSSDGVVDDRYLARIASSPFRA